MKKPNVILINCDDLGYGDLGCYGSKINKTPAIDKLAYEGVVFTSFYMASSLCSPSRGAMLTGCYPRRIGFDKFDNGFGGVLFPGDSEGLDPSEITIANILKDAGYSTKLVGKWHCGDQPEFLPTRFGFDSYYGLPYSNDMGMSYADDLDKRYQDLLASFPPLPLVDGEDVVEEQPDQATITERYVEQSIKFIRENQDKPFFLYLAHMHVHLPHITPERFSRQSENGPFGAALECVDWATDVIMFELKKLGLDGNTIIIFTSDNGSVARMGASNKPLRGAKSSCWEGGFRVPCIIRWPEKVKSGRRYEDIVASMDFLPTLAKICGGKMPDDRIIDGTDISGIISGSEDIKDRTFYYYYQGDLCALRQGRYKYFIDSPHYGEALYDLEDDISEEKDIIETNPEIAEKMKQAVNDCRKDLGDDLKMAEGNNRPIGKVDNPKTLTQYDPSHPYMIAMYDLSGGNCG
jgi:arylsulfatase A-like enzyme